MSHRRISVMRPLEGSALFPQHTQTPLVPQSSSSHLGMSRPMNAVPGLKTLPRVTWMRPPGPLIVQFETHVHPPSAWRRKQLQMSSIPPIRAIPGPNTEHVNVSSLQGNKHVCLDACVSALVEREMTGRGPRNLRHHDFWRRGLLWRLRDAGADPQCER